MAASRVRRRDHEEEHDNEERWLLTYADMITLLMVLFIVLFSIGQINIKKFEQLRSGLAASFGTSQNAVLDGGAGVLDGGESPLDEQSAQQILDQQRAAAAASTRQLQQTADEVKKALAGQGLGDKVTFRLEARGLVLQIVTDQVLFDLGKADLRPEGRAVLDGLAAALKDVPNAISVEGHTDNRPISGFPFTSNWELSTYRATTVVRYLIDEKGLDRKRISAAGYGEERPLVPNDTAAHQSQNRRVEIVVLAPAQTTPADGSTTPETNAPETNTNTSTNTSTTDGGTGGSAGGERGQGAS
ncbi:MAG: OmpA/MotB domain protein [Actinomycetia bacterium]|nr:OmpA/MotB domain protein [Actinomycetes bacterium]